MICKKWYFEWKFVETIVERHSKTLTQFSLSYVGFRQIFELFNDFYRSAIDTDWLRIAQCHSAGMDIPLALKCDWKFYSIYILFCASRFYSCNMLDEYLTNILPLVQCERVQLECGYTLFLPNLNEREYFFTVKQINNIASLYVYVIVWLKCMIGWLTVGMCGSETLEECGIVKYRSTRIPFQQSGDNCFCSHFVVEKVFVLSLSTIFSKRIHSKLKHWRYFFMSTILYISC